MSKKIVFLGRTRSYTVAVERDKLYFVLPAARGTSSIQLTFEGSLAADPQGIEEASFRTNSYLGTDVSKFRSGIRNFSRIGMSHVYPGVDAEFYASGDEIEHDFNVAPGADAHSISMLLNSEKTARLTAEGEVIVPSAEGELRFKKPVAYQIGTEGQKTPIPAAFALESAHKGQRIRFNLGAYDHSRKLVIDPVILYASYLAGASGSTADVITTEPTNGVFVAGTTNAASFDPTPAGNPATAVTPTSNCTTTPCSTSAYIANFTNGSSGPTLRWVTYIGATDNPSSSQLEVSSIAANSTNLYLGGYTIGAAIAASSSAMAPNPAAGLSGRMGYISSLTPATGALNDTAVIYGDENGNDNTVEALALDAIGNLYAAGELGFSGPDPGIVTPSTDAFAVSVLPTTNSASALPPDLGNAYVLRLDVAGTFSKATTHFVNPSFFTYIQQQTRITGIAVDAGGSVYLAGGSASPFTLPGIAVTHAGPNGLPHAFELTFQIISSNATVTQFAWLTGSGNETAAGIALDGAGNSYVFGNTTSTDLGATAGTVQSTMPDATGSGFVALIPTAPGTLPSVGSTPTALTYLGGSGSHDTTTGGTFANNTLYITGKTDAPSTTSAGVSTALAGLPSTTFTTAAPFNTQALPQGMDGTVGGIIRGYLTSLKGDLTATNYVANIGGAGASDSANGVALDSSQNAFVASTIGFASSSAATPYASYTAYQGTSPATTSNTSAYVAEIAYAPASTTLNLQIPATGSPSIDPLTTTTGAVTYTWALDTTSTAPVTDLVVQIPNVAGLTYNTLSITDVTSGSLLATALCVIQPGTGASCVIPSVPQATAGTNDQLSIILGATTNAILTGPTLAITASVTSAASDYTTVSQTSNIASNANLSITGTEPTVTLNAGSTTSTTTYTLTVSNAAGAGESKTTSLILSPLNGFHGVSANAVVAGGGSQTCGFPVPTNGCPSFDLPAGASLTYTVTGYFDDTAVPANVATAAVGSLSVNVAGFGSSPTANIPTNTTVQRSVHLKITGALSSNAATINLDAPETYTVTVTNSGPSASSGNDTFSVSLPSTFTPDPNPSVACSTSSPAYHGCTFPTISGGSLYTIAISGKFPDATTSITASVTSQPFSAMLSALVDAGDSAPLVGDQSTGTANASVQRLAPLTVTSNPLLTAPASVCSNGSTACVYMKNTPDTGDKVAYNFVISNGGPNTALNAAVTITLPFASSTHAFAVGTPTVAVQAPTFGVAPSCSYNGAITNQIVCTVGNISGNKTLSITGNGTFDNTSVPTGVAFVTTSVGAIHITEDAMGTPLTDTALPTLQVDRAAHLVTAKSVAATGTSHSLPINLDENLLSTVPGINDTFTVTVQVGNTPLSDAPGVVVTEMLPPYFRLIQPPPVAANCTVGLPAVAVTAGYTTPGTSVSMTCAVGTVTAGNAVASSSGAVSVGSTPQSFTYSGKFLDNGVNPDITGTLPAKVKQLSAPLGVASATTLAVDPISPSDATSAAQSIAVERLAHLILRKTRNASVAVAPSSFADITDPNLDEKTTSTSFGANDEIEYDIAVGNAGVNTALGVQFTETLPPYFTLVKAYLIAGAAIAPDTGANMAPSGQLPANSVACYAGSTIGTVPIALPYATGAVGQQITCSYGTPAAPLSLSAGPSHTGAPDNGTSIEFVYQGKYQDNAPGTDNIGLGVSTASIVSAVGDATASSLLVVDNGPATDSRSLPVPTYSIQRAAHLTIVGTPAQLKPDESPLTSGGAGGTSIIAEAEPSSIGNPIPVYNCLRYKVLVQNIGPNIARQPQLTVVPPMGLNLTQSPSGVTATPGSDAPLPSSCVYGATTSPVINGAAIAPVSQRAGNTLVIDLDGYFGLNTLTSGNSQTGFPLSYTALADKGVMDSAKTMAFTPLTGNNITVVNTPSGGNFLVSPFTAAGPRPASLAFGSVVTPGITTIAVAGTGPALPVGSSPDPRDNKKTVPLYRTGSTPVFYALGTTAIPTPGTNPTGICLTNGSVSGPLADGFAKPERVLLWALSGLPLGTALNAVPNVAAPYPGDITTSVTPSSGSSYVVPGGLALPYTSYANLPGPQSQPGQVCGQINGFASVGTPVTVAVLEPVNFAPYISPNAQQILQTPGKGVSEVSFLFPTVTHDYNDNDPCYVSNIATETPGRGTCDDNLLLTTWVFGGESLVPSLSHVIGPLSPSVAKTFENAPTPYEIQGNATLFLQVTDQLAAFAYNAKQDCDPGNAPGSYVPNTVNACPINTALLAGTPPQETVFGSGDIAMLTPSVGGGGSGLIALPPAADATMATTSVATGFAAAAATVTAGQTVGFQWKLGDVIPATGGTYNLTCFMVDAATQNTTMAFPAGLSCQIPQSITFPANPTPANSPANPAIYVVTTGTSTASNTHLGWETATGGAIAALLLPLLLFRRNGHPKKLGLLVILLLLGGAVSLSGCGSGINLNSTSAVAANTYYFRANATPVNGGTMLTTAAFQVKVVTGN